MKLIFGVLTKLISRNSMIYLLHCSTIFMVSYNKDFYMKSTYSTNKQIQNYCNIFLFLLANYFKVLLPLEELQVLFILYYTNYIR